MKVAVNTAKLLRNVPLPDEIATVHDNAVVVDMGSGTTRVGFSGDDAPRLSVPTVVGAAPDGTTEVFAKAYKMRESSPLTWPLERTLVTDWSGTQSMLQHIYDILNLGADPAPLLLSEAALVPKEQREQLVQILFETIRVQSLYFAMAPVLALYASGRTTGIVMEMGLGTCHTVPVFEGFGLFHSILQMDFGGQDLTNFIGAHVTKSGVNFPPAHTNEIHQYLKEVHCSAMPDRGAYSAAVNGAKKNDVVFYRLPDGAEVPLGTERHTPAEALFDPSLIGKEGRGIHQLAVDSIRKCDVDIGPTLFSNIVMSGGTSLFSGLPDRTQLELHDLAPQEKIRIYAATERRNATWVGGSILASLPTFQDMWVTRQEYEETGVETRRCLATRNCF